MTGRDARPIVASRANALHNRTHVYDWNHRNTDHRPCRRRHRQAPHARSRPGWLSSDDSPRHRRRIRGGISRPGSWLVRTGPASGIYRLRHRRDALVTDLPINPSAPRPAAITWRSAAIIGACLLLCGNGGVTISEKYIDSGLAAVIVATVPIYIVLLSWASGSAPRPGAPVLLGLAGGFVGVGILMAPSLHFAIQENRRAATGMLILLFTSFMWSVGSLYSRRATSAESPFLAAGQQMMRAGALLRTVGLLAR